MLSKWTYEITTSANLRARILAHNVVILPLLIHGYTTRSRYPPVGILSFHPSMQRCFRPNARMHAIPALSPSYFPRVTLPVP
jgi:hypothetical protein